MSGFSRSTLYRFIKDRVALDLQTIAGAESHNDVLDSEFDFAACADASSIENGDSHIGDNDDDDASMRSCLSDFDVDFFESDCESGSFCGEGEASTVDDIYNNPHTEPSNDTMPCNENNSDAEIDALSSQSSLREELSAWAVQYNITVVALTALLFY